MLLEVLGCWWQPGDSERPISLLVSPLLYLLKLIYIHLRISSVVVAAILISAIITSTITQAAVTTSTRYAPGDGTATVGRFISNKDGLIALLPMLA